MRNENHTLDEFQQRINLSLLNFGKASKEAGCDFKNLADCMPVGMLINHRNGRNVFMNTLSRQILNFTAEELEELGTEYQTSYVFNPSEIQQLMPVIKGQFARNDDTEIVSFFQQIRPQGREEYEWMYISSRLLKDEGETESNKRLLVACPVNDMGPMANKISRVLDENTYMKRHFKTFSILTKREKEILTQVALGKENPQIADELFISRNTVEQHRKNIRNKLGFKNIVEIIRFATAFELI